MENQAGNPITPETNNTTNTETQQLNNPTIPIVEPKMDGYSKYAIASLLIALIPVVLFLYCYVASDGSTNEGGAGAVWWMVIIYYWTLGIPLAIASIVLAIMGLKSKFRWASIVSLSLKVLVLATILLPRFF
jgi:hypothetical protein